MNEQIGGLGGIGIVISTLDDGHSKLESYGTHFNRDSPFEIGSITKTLTAILFADMIEKHEVKPNDWIERYLPKGARVPVYKRQHITLEELATQSSGLPRMPTNFSPKNPADPYIDYTNANLLSFLATFKMARSPGSSYESSNLGFGLLGYVLAHRLGVPYSTAIRTRILEPLGMSHTVFATAERAANTVGGRDADGEPTPNRRLDALAGAGAIVSTPSDMLRYARANLDTAHGPLGAAIRLAHLPRRNAGGNHRRIGFAWMTQSDGIIWHNGGTDGFRTFLGVDPAHKRAIIVLADAFIDGVDRLGFYALDQAWGLPAAPVADFAVKPATLHSYVGRYGFADGSIGTVAYETHVLRISFDRPVFHARFHPLTATTFVTRTQPLTITFAGTNPVKQIIVEQTDQKPDIGKRM